jgi:hypothetical protein
MHTQDTLMPADRRMMRWVIWGAYAPLVLIIGSGVFLI